MFTPMKPIEHLLLAFGVLAVVTSVGLYFHLTLQKQVKAQQAEADKLRSEIRELSKGPRLAEIERLRGSIKAASVAREQLGLLRQVRRFTGLQLNMAALRVAGSDSAALCQRLHQVTFWGQEAQPEVGPDGVVTVRPQ